MAARPRPEAPDTALDAIFREAVGHHGAGRVDAAITLYDRVLARRPDHPDALHMKAVAAAQAGRLDEGIALLRRAIEAKDDVVDYHNNLGHLLAMAGRTAEAETALRRALDLAPDHAAAHNNLGDVLERDGRLPEALDAYRRAAALVPDNASVHGNLGVVLQRLGRPDEAVAAFRQAAALDPDSPEAHNNLGSALQTVERLEEAEAELRRAIALRPDYANAWHNLGGVLMARGAAGDAVAALRHAVELNPQLAGAWANLAAGLNLLERYEDGAAAAQRAIALAPTLAEAFNNLGVALRAQGYNDAAEAAYRRAVELDPAHAVAHSNLIFVLDFNAAHGIAEIQAERRRWNILHAAPLAAGIRRHGNDRDPGRRLRIGYVSADFRGHSAANSFGPMILAHDRDRFDAVCYSGNLRDDAMTDRFRAAATLWRDCGRSGDTALAETIRADGIDILVDLSGHTAGNRLLVFARKPAPVQATAWGHAVGTGLDAIDYFLADPVVVPETEAHFYAEKIRYLPTLLTYLPPEHCPDVAPGPAAAAGHITFGSFNRLEKVNDVALDLWRRILERVPGSRLLIKSQALDRPAVRAGFEERLARVGFAPGRVDLLGGTPQPDHLALHGRVDLMLDPFPHSGGASTGDALWMGVPVVTLRGGTVHGRLAASTLHALALDRLIAGSPEDYIEIAVAAGRDAAFLADLRSSLRARMTGTPVGDTVRYCRAVEAVYRAIWREWCEGDAG